jgi:predicted amino acid racemase
VYKRQDIGDVKRLVVAIGRQDAILEDLRPLDGSLSMLGGSSDHMVLHDKDDSYSVGDIVSFIPSYGALVGLITSRYVRKVHL